EGDGIDPHIWFAPSVMAQFAIAVGEAFAQADPAAAGQYRDRADGVAATLDGLHREIDELLADCRHDTVIVSHEAYAYLLSERGIRQEGVSGAGGHGEATPQRIAALVDTIRRDRITAVLTEPVEGRQDAESVAAEAGVDLIQIYSLDIVDDQQRASGYPQLVLEQAEAVARALECG
ncbi:MAG TPA: metal ABC transporter substrate-binding protein, partial [Egibacteraceae bacterium]|nr:metal ABC transporter substrate-binding protein [Egibacteraceae bacterium]